MATRAEMRRPGIVERAFDGVGGGFGGMAVPLLGSFATAFAGTLAAEALFSDLADGELFDGPQGDEAGDQVADAGGDPGGADLSDFGDLGGGDFGGDAGF